MNDQDSFEAWKKAFYNGEKDIIAKRFSTAARFSWGRLTDERRLAIQALCEIFKNKNKDKAVARELWVALPEKGGFIRHACRTNEDLARYLGNTFCDTDKNAMALKNGLMGVFPDAIPVQAYPEYQPDVAPQTRIGLVYLALRQGNTCVDFAPPDDVAVVCAEMGFTELMEEYRLKAGHISSHTLRCAAILGNQKETLSHLLHTSEDFAVRQSLEYALEMERNDLVKIAAERGGVSAFALQKAWNNKNILALEVMLPFAKDSNIFYVVQGLFKSEASLFRDTVATLKMKKSLEEELEKTGNDTVKRKKL